MKEKRLSFIILMSALVLLFAPFSAVSAADNIVIGCPLSTAFLYGWDAERGVKLAVDEINAKGGVNVGGKKLPFKVEVIDTRDLEPGVPVSDALMAVEKLILEKKADFIIGGPVRSEAALAAMDLLGKYKKVSILTTGVLTPAYHARVEKEYDKLKYCFRIHGEAVQLVKEIMACFKEIQEKFGLNKVFIMVQDVAHARGGGDVLGKVAAKAGWTVTGRKFIPPGPPIFPWVFSKPRTRRHRFSTSGWTCPKAPSCSSSGTNSKSRPFPSAPPWRRLSSQASGRPRTVKVNLRSATWSMQATLLPKPRTWTMKFYDAYTKKWNIEPEGLGSSSSYMAVYVLKDAIERANSIDSDKVVDALEKTDMMGVYGRIRFNPKNHQVIPALDPKEGAVGTILQWQAGKRVVVFPKSIATGEIQLPPWMKK